MNPARSLQPATGSRRRSYGRDDLARRGREGRGTLIERGLVATTNPGGAGKWRYEYSETLRGARVVILPDNDDPGRQHAQSVAQHLQGVAAEVRVPEWRGLPEKRGCLRLDQGARGGRTERPPSQPARLWSFSVRRLPWFPPAILLPL